MSKYCHDVHPSWLDVFTPLADDLLAIEAQIGTDVVPAPPLVYRAFAMPVEAVRVILLGQDPYPTPGHAIGLSFAANKDVRPIPRSIANMYTELESDLGIPAAEHADLSAWSDQGVLLLNASLTTRPGTAGAHQNVGWDRLTRAAIARLVERHVHAQPMAALLLGAKAHAYDDLLRHGGVPIVSAPHPSPLSAYRGFFGSKVFSRVNDSLLTQGSTPINWEIH